MSMKWDLYKELRRSQTVDDERMQQQKAQNIDLLWQVYFAGICLVFALWCVHTSEHWSWAWWLWFLTLSLALWQDALGWYNGTVLAKFRSLQQGHRIKLALEILCCSLVVPMALGGLVLATLHRPRLTWAGAVLAAVSYYLLRVWCYDQYRRQTLAPEVYEQSSPEEQQENSRAQRRWIALAAILLLLGLLLPETMLPGGGELRRLAAIEQAVNAYEQAETIAYDYHSGETHVTYYHLPEEELAMYADDEGNFKEAWLTSQGYTYHYDGADWQRSDEPAADRPKLLAVSREQLGEITAEPHQVYTVQFDEEALAGQVLRLAWCPMASYDEAEATYYFYEGQLMLYTCRVNGQRQQGPETAYCTIQNIQWDSEQVAAQLAQQKANLAANNL